MYSTHTLVIYAYARIVFVKKEKDNKCACFRFGKVHSKKYNILSRRPDFQGKKLWTRSFEMNAYLFYLEIRLGGILYDI